MPNDDGLADYINDLHTDIERRDEALNQIYQICHISTRAKMGAFDQIRALAKPFARVKRETTS